jgi:hypothetical protein
MTSEDSFEKDFNSKLLALDQEKILTSYPTSKDPPLFTLTHRPGSSNSPNNARQNPQIHPKHPKVSSTKKYSNKYSSSSSDTNSPPGNPNPKSVTTNQNFHTEKLNFCDKFKDREMSDSDDSDCNDSLKKTDSLGVGLGGQNFQKTQFKEDLVRDWKGGSEGLYENFE